MTRYAGVVQTETAGRSAVERLWQAERMVKVTLLGWRVGFNKVQFNRFLRDRCDMGLAEAKAVVDKVLKNECVDIEFDQLSYLDTQSLVELGVKFEEAR